MNPKIVLALIAISATDVSADSLSEGRHGTDIESVLRSCRDDPRYSIGGAMIGDCLRDHSEAVVEPKIARILHRASKRYCTAESRERLRAAQSHWENYRESYCSLIEDSPGNTPAYVNGSACHLEATQQRLAALSILEDYAYDRCPQLSFLHEASRFGPPQAEPAAHDASGIAWRIADTEEASTLLVEAGGTETITFDTTGCTYCESDADCSQGTFLFEYPVSIADQAAGDRPDFDYALLHACQADDGIRFEIASGLLDRPRIDLSEVGLAAFDWNIEHDRIVISSPDQRDGIQWTIPGSDR